MPTFDPEVPRPKSKVRSAELRDNFNALNDKIEAIPDPQQGPPGPPGADSTVPGPVGPAGADSTVPGPQGSTGPEGRGIASVYDDGYGRAVVQMSDGATYGPFTIASGPAGGQGSPGSDGRSVTNIRDTGSGSFMVDMSDGSSYGPFTPPAGQQGPAGEVSNQQLNDAINGTPRNVDGFSQLYITISDPPTQSEMQQILDSYNSLIIALRRNV